MNFTEIPDDIWFSIFEQLDDPPTLAILVRTCRRFHGLASKLLLRELKWIKPDLTLRNIEAWAAIYSSLVALPRKITIGVPFEFTHAMKLPIPHVSPRRRLLKFLPGLILLVSRTFCRNEASRPHTHATPTVHIHIRNLPGWDFDLPVYLLCAWTDPDTSLPALRELQLHQSSCFFFYKSLQPVPTPTFRPTFVSARPRYRMPFGNHLGGAN